MPLPPIERMPTEAVFALDLAKAQWGVKFRPAHKDAFGIPRWSVVRNARNYGSWPDPNFAVLIRDREVVIQTLAELGIPAMPTRQIHEMLETMRPEQVILHALSEMTIRSVLEEMGL